MYFFAFLTIFVRVIIFVGTSMLKYYFYLLIVIAVCACKSEPKFLRTEKMNLSEASNIELNSDRLLTVEIKGMSCEMACGASIEKALLNTGSVKTCDIEFHKNRIYNVAKIEYNSNEITSDRLIKLITEINDKQFETGTKIDNSIDSSEKATVQNSSSNKNESSLNNFKTQDSDFKTPSLLHLISRFFFK